MINQLGLNNATAHSRPLVNQNKPEIYYVWTQLESILTDQGRRICIFMTAKNAVTESECRFMAAEHTAGVISLASVQSMSCHIPNVNV